MRKATWMIAITGAALTVSLSAPVIAHASTGTRSATTTTATRQLSAVSAKEVSRSGTAQPALGLGDSFWESPQGGHTITTDCISGNTAGVHNWSSTCANHEDQVHDATGYYARVHYYPNGYGAYACMNPHSYWLYLSTSHYDFSYPGEGYQPWGATAGQYQLIYDNAASEALANSCA
jgi:hypothetical protein